MNTITNTRRKDLRWQLLVSVSAAALLASAYVDGIAEAADNDSDRPLVWIELSGQLDQLTDSQEAFNPSFMAAVTRPSLLSALNVQRPPAYAIDEEGKISFQPDDSDWIFSASVRFGRPQSGGHKSHQTKNAQIPVHASLPTFGVDNHKYYYPTIYNRFSEGLSHQSERHFILDFEAGKDVGLGMFGGGGSSVLSAGVRFAQLNSEANVTLHALPDLQYPTKPVTVNSIPALLAFLNTSIPPFHDYTGEMNATRSFNGAGPSLAWSASVPVSGNAERGELTFDWGANAAVLFGRQKANGRHDTETRTYAAHEWRRHGIYNGYHTVGYFFGGGQYPHPLPHTNAGNFDRARMVAVPNLGGFAGLSVRYQEAKISFGYRADFFFNAIDGGIDARKEENRGFFGPFASISVGIGD